MNNGLIELPAPVPVERLPVSPTHLHRLVDPGPYILLPPLLLAAGTPPPPPLPALDTLLQSPHPPGDTLLPPPCPAQDTPLSEHPPNPGRKPVSPGSLGSSMTAFD